MIIPVVVHYESNRPGVYNRRRTFYRVARCYQKVGDQETAQVQIHGQRFWATRYSHTVWTVDFPYDLQKRAAIKENRHNASRRSE